MAEFTVRSDSVDAEQIMRQIRARIREKRGVDYTEAEIEKLASVKLEKFLDPRGIRSDLVQQFRASMVTDQQQEAFNEALLYESHRPAVKKLRRMLNPILKLFINPAAIAGAFQSQTKRNYEALFFEVVHNLVVEVTRLGIETHNLKMRVESMASRLDFDERRARAFEGSLSRPQRVERPRQANPVPSGTSAAPAGDGQVSYANAMREPSAGQPAMTPQAQQQGPPQPQSRPDGQFGGQRPDGGRRRRRRRRRRPGSNLADAGGHAGAPNSGGGAAPAVHAHDHDDHDEGPEDGGDDQ